MHKWTIWTVIWRRKDGKEIGPFFMLSRFSVNVWSFFSKINNLSLTKLTFIISGLFAYRRSCSEEISSLPSSVFKLISVSWLVLIDTDCGILPPGRVEIRYFLGKSWLLEGYRLWEDKQTTKEEGEKKIVEYTQTRIHHQLSSVCLWSVSVFGIRSHCVCVCVCASIARWCLVWAEPVQTWTPAA